MTELEWVRGEDGVGKYAPMPSGGGSLPAQWTVGPEGELTITPDPGGSDDTLKVTAADGAAMLQVAPIDTLNGNGRLLVSDLGTFWIDTNSEIAGAMAENGVFTLGGTTQVPGKLLWTGEKLQVTLSESGFFQISGHNDAEIFRIEDFNHYCEFKKSSGAKLLVLSDDGLGFFGTTAQAKPTGVAVDAAGIHAALVTLGLIAA